MRHATTVQAPRVLSSVEMDGPTTTGPELRLGRRVRVVSV